MNDLMSGGVHRLWKNRFMGLVRPSPGERLLDVAGGTGDIALRVLDRAGPGGRATICDLSENMVRVGRDRAVDRGGASGIDVRVGNAEAPTEAERAGEAYTLALGPRHATTNQ